ncbi:hypothetical protein BX661DRAFT_183966 [Kickxella alabastrina]|uniref:uncharacterized protein n=1 Tax=Kickxella alabastrina TaxID=61397 RepID=UPI0022211434|nr:uncharacterized protein BX661DRAFT_183966 [Kickxella alabastrina]KAI7826400.1 hypothetical protein BX661DRAFT_183966 [Kickxella alabastrina]
MTSLQTEAPSQSGPTKALPGSRRTNSSPMTIVDKVRFFIFAVFFIGHSAVLNICQMAVCPWLSLLSPVNNRRFNQYIDEGNTSSSSNAAMRNISSSVDSSWFAPAIEHGCMLISNHQTYFDWIIIWMLGYMCQCDGYIKIILKAELKKVPRKWADDQKTFKSHMQRIVDHKDPSWLLIFPEGTVLCDKRIAISDSMFCLNQLRGRIPYIYDLTIGYEGLKKGDIPEDEYGLVSMYGKCVYPREVHIHVKRYAVEDIPIDEEGFSRWMHKVFVEKDMRMAKYYELGRFPHDHSEDSSIPADEPVLRAVQDAKAKYPTAEFVFMWAQILAILIPARYVLRFALSKASALLAGLF